MKSVKERRICLVLAAFVLTGSPFLSAAKAASFEGLGDLPGGMLFSDVNSHCISGNGSVVVGRSHSASGYRAFRWTASGGMQDLGDLPGGASESSAWAVSADGLVAVGWSYSASGFEAFRWTAGTAMQGLGYLPGGSSFSMAIGTSADGSVVVGGSDAPSGYQAFRWTQSEGMVSLEDPPGSIFPMEATDVSADGAVVVGKGISVSGAEAFRWTQSGGMTGLGDLPGGYFSSEATAVSADGSVIVGNSMSASGYEAFRWTESKGMVGLGYVYSCADSVSGDGSVVVGSIGWNDAFIWDAVHGMRSLKGVLESEYGLDLTGWSLKMAKGISDDASAIAGWGINPNGNAEAWIARISEPGQETISKPGTPSGPTAPIVNTTYTYSTSGAASSLGHALEYRFNWGDGSTSGWSTSKSASHAWSSTGTRAITVTARCRTHTDRTNTSDPLQITVVPDEQQPELELIGLEVIQTVQDWQNTVPLIEWKTTYVRAHVQTKGTIPIENVTGMLHVFQNGAYLGSVYPLRPITARPNAADRRDQWWKSLNFQIQPPWCSGTIKFCLEVDGLGLECMDVAPLIPNDCCVEVDFVPSETPRVVFVAVTWVDLLGGRHSPMERLDTTLEELGPALAEDLKAMYPIADLDWDIRPYTYYATSLPWPGLSVFPDMMRLNDELGLMAIQEKLQSGISRLYYGLVFDTWFASGLALSIPCAGEGWVACGDKDSMPHEFGHCFGLDHTVNSISSPNWPIVKSGPCGETALWCALEFPYVYEVDESYKAIISPMGMGPERLIYGLDTDDRQPNVLDPTTPEIMSYCGGGMRWASDITYKSLKAAIDERFGGSAGKMRIRSSSTTDYLVLRGNIDLETETAQFLPFVHLSNPVIEPSPPPAGDFVLELRDDSNNLVATVSFSPMEYVASSGGEDPCAGSFIVFVPVDPNIRRVVVTHNTNVIGSVTASGNSPTVQVISPNGGETFDGNQVVFEWTGDDPDGNNLTYVVQYSANAGSTWETLTVDWPDPNCHIERKYLKATNSALIRVIASDGFNTAVDESDGLFTVVNNPPDVVLFTPKENTLFLANQLIFFEAGALDREDGQLAATSLQWYSDVDGPLGTGKIVVRDANEFSEGYHRITVTATDSGGLSDTASVRIWVSQSGPPTMEVAMKFTPQAMNPGSEGKWVKAHFVMPRGVRVEDVNSSVPAWIDPLGIASDYVNAFFNEEGMVEVEAAFDRAAFCEGAIGNEPLEVTVTGWFTNGQYFHGTDTIKITTNNFKWLAVFASYWLQPECDKPHWCGGLDFNQDGAVNFLDFALFDGCCIEVLAD
ncbi:MAG TPA: hypothetical protein VMX13_09720 [Sedimentisphaerales bacterium]|nr:hypothetical protein [Sedimentisphaerales bacterium]